MQSIQPSRLRSSREPRRSPFRRSVSYFCRPQPPGNVANYDYPREKFPPLSDENKCALVTNLGMIACAGATGLSGTHDGPDSELAPCCICDMNTPEEQALVPWRSPGFSAVRSTLTNILSNLGRTPSPRIASMLALRRILVHDPDSNQLDLTSSMFGELCLHSLRSSVREIRLAAGYSRSVFFL